MKFSVFIFCVYLKHVSSSFCYWNSGCPFKFFSDKTPYNNVRGDMRDSIVKLKGCQPISIWSLLSTAKNTAEIDLPKTINECFSIREKVVSSYKSGKSSLCAQDVENLQNWKTDNKMLSQTNFLTEEGSQELIGIANRLQQAFPSLLQNLKDGNHKLSSAKGLMEESVRAFVKNFKERLTITKTNDNIILIKDFEHLYASKYTGITENFPALKDKIFELAKLRTKTKDKHLDFLTTYQHGSEEASNIACLRLIPSLLAVTSVRLKNS